MHKTKKKTKPVKLPKPIKIKKEKTEEDRTPQPMSHYIDDRLELVKQIFGTLKPKTITNLAPDFLKKKAMDEIEELCLNELLGISTKRLLSIINASECPTDTESSGDSDVEHKEEHISLEEISSDSELEEASSSAAKKRANKKAVKSTTENNQNDGQISVLELLELQARARAIRSQLAHEPVTKIEVDSDEGDAANTAAVESKSSSDRKESRRERKRKSSEQDQQRAAAGRSQKSSGASTSKPSKSNGSTEVENKESDKPTSKKIKLKRTYRNGSTKNESAAIAENNKPLTTEPTVGRNSRSASPDVIPIVTDCVTLLISDDSEDEEPVVKAIALATNNGQEKPKSDDQLVEQRKVRKATETEEEGEIVEKEKNQEQVTDEINKNTELTNEKDESKSSNEAIGKEIPPTEDIVGENAKPEDSGKPQKSPTSEDSNSVSSVSENKEESKATEDLANVEKTSTIIEEQQLTAITSNEAATNPLEDDDQNDDVISIGGGDLESEMSDHLTQEDTKKSSPKAVANEEDADIISLSLESSEDERTKAEMTESWHARYLKSSKVSKVLATSRLGKRVRDKIKKSKRSKKDSMREADAEAAAAAAKQSLPSSSSFASKHEDGSVEQYKELLEMRPRKT